MRMVSGGLMGWLTKKGELRRNWNSRWTILIPSRLMIYFTDESCENFKGCAGCYFILTNFYFHLISFRNVSVITKTYTQFF